MQSKSAETHRGGRIVAAGLVLLCGFAAARVLAPAWSVPMAAFPLAVSVQPGLAGDRFYVLMADGGLALVSARDTLRMLGPAPAGATALAAVPEAAGEPSLFFAVAGLVVATDSTGRELWRTRSIFPGRIDSLRYAGRDARHRLRLCAWTGSEVRVAVVAPDTAGVALVRAGTAPLNSSICPAGIPALVAAGPDGLLLVDLSDGRELRMPRPAGAVGCADIDGDSLYEVLVLTDPSSDGAGFDTLRCLDALNLRQHWSVGIGIGNMSGYGTAVLAGPVRVHVAGVASDGSGLVAAYDELGRRQATVSISSGRGRPFAMVAVGGWPLVLLQTAYGPQSALLLPPGLAGSAGETPGYNGVRFQRVVPLRLGPDTFPDVLVLRTAVDAPVRMDVFNNDLAAVAAQLAAQRLLLRAAAARHDDAAITRAERRLRLLEAELNPGATTTVREEIARARARRRVSRMMLWFGLLLLAAAAAAVGLVIALDRRARRRAATGLIEQMPLSTRVALAMDLVAMDHNFVSKGNWPAALERLREVCRRYGLEQDIDHGRASGDVVSWYTRAASRLVDGTATENVLDLISTAARRARPGDAVSVDEKTREQLRREAGQPGFRIVCLRNREYPDIYGRLRLFSNARLRGIIEHLTIDHCRYARERATIVFDYTVSTQWNRKLSIRFYSDARETIDFSRSDSHLVSELTEVAASLSSAAEIPGPDRRPTAPDDAIFGQPHELKLYVRFADLISVLDETRRRLVAAGSGSRKAEGDA